MGILVEVSKNMNSVAALGHLNLSNSSQLSFQFDTLFYGIFQVAFFPRCTTVSVVSSRESEAFKLGKYAPTPLGALKTAAAMGNQARDLVRRSATPYPLSRRAGKRRQVVWAR